VNTKICGKCNIEKEISEFSKDKSKKDGLGTLCKDCKSKYHKDYYKINSSFIKQHQTIYRIKNKEVINLKQIQYRKRFPNSWYKWFEKNKLYRKNYMNAYYKVRRKNDIIFKLSGDIRTRINEALKENLKSKRTLDLLGCSVEFLKKHLESQFKPGMTWDNHTIHGWHIDHIKPCTKFDLNKVEEQKKCFHYSNLQPLWAKENLYKGNKCYEPISSTF
jgi:hypothetical protein